MSQAPEASLWEEVREVLRFAAQIWGAPAELWDEVVLPRGEARRLAAWLASLEAAVRALLAAMAARLPAPSPARRRAAADAAPRAQTADETAAEHGAAGSAGSGFGAPARDAPAPDFSGVDAPLPETPDSSRWAGVRLRLARGTSRGGGRGGGRGVRCFLSVRGLAFRLEALIRVAAAPEIYARRLARRLRADPALARRLVSGPRDRKDRTPPPYAELVTDALSAARIALGLPAPETG